MNIHSTKDILEQEKVNLINQNQTNYEPTTIKA
jgi:hypothetical protein